MLTLPYTQWNISTTVSAFPACTQILYANAEGQLQAMRNALFIFLKGAFVCTRDDGASGEGAGGDRALV